MVASMRMERDPVQNKQPKPVSASGPDGWSPPSPALTEDAWRFISPAVELGEEEEGAGLARLRRAGHCCHDGPDPPQPGGTASGRGTGWGLGHLRPHPTWPSGSAQGSGPWAACAVGTFPQDFLAKWLLRRCKPKRRCGLEGIFRTLRADPTSEEGLVNNILLCILFSMGRNLGKEALFLLQSSQTPKILFMAQQKHLILASAELLSISSRKSSCIRQG